MNNLVREHAPELALRPRSEWITAEPDAGMAPPENLYDAQGNPLNWIQDAGGQRQFLSTGGPVAAPSAPVRTRATAAPRPIDNLRGMTNPETGTFGSTVPLMPRPAPAPIRGRIGLEPEVPTQTPYVAPRATVRVPSEVDERVTQQSNRQRQVEDRVIGAAIDSRAAGNMRNPRQTTRAEPARPAGEGAQSRGIGGRLNVNPNGSLLEMLQSLNFNVELPLRGRSGDTEDSNGLSPEQLGLPTIDRPVDIYADINSGGRVTPASAGPPGNWAGRATDVAAVLRDSGRVRVTSAVRTNNAVAGGHGDGNSIDIDPADIEAAREIISRQYPGMPVEYLFIRRGQQFGNGVVATGDHYHIDLGPAAGPRRRTQPRR